jgi:two-component system sensor histidine kinase/response regulator
MATKPVRPTEIAHGPMSSSDYIMNRDFLSHLSHELRTPMNGVMGMTELLAANELSPRHRNVLDAIQHSAETLWEVIDDFLDFARLEGGAMALKDASLDPCQVAEDVVELLAEAAHTKLLELICYISPDCAGTVRGDPKRVRQVLDNLVGTAIRLAHEGDIILKVEIRSADSNYASLRFTVECNGATVDPQRFDRFFEPFSIADDATIDRHHATGLGLAVARRLVDLMGGKLSVERGSDEEGLMFTFDLSVRLTKGTKHTRMDAAALTGVRVLVVSENANQRAVLSHQLRDYGAEAEVANDGEMALDRLKTRSAEGQPYAAIVAERDMVQTDGLTLARQLSKEPAIGDTPVLLLNMTTQESDPDEFQGTGIVNCFMKPVSARRLADAITEVAVTHANPGGAIPLCLAETEAIQSLTGIVLVVEDNQVNREIVVSMLKMLGCQCGSAENGQQALHALSARHYDLILMDCQMPLMDGFEATRAIRRLEHTARKGRRLPIVALTANDMDGDRERCLGVGMDDFLAKPYRKNQLQEVLTRWLPHGSNNS